MKDEIEQLDAEFAERLGERRVDPRMSREYWERFEAIRENNSRKALIAEIGATVDRILKPHGIFIKDLGQGYYWLRTRGDKGLEFRHLQKLDQELPQGRGIVRILEKHKGFIIVIG